MQLATWQIICYIVGGGLFAVFEILTVRKNRKAKKAKKAAENIVPDPGTEKSDSVE